MRTRTVRLGLMLGVCVNGLCFAGEAGLQPLRLELHLVDGSRIVGVPSIETAVVQTPYAKMDVPLQQIRSMKIGKDRETVSFDLKNGDKFTGVITLGAVRLETAFGKVSIGVEHLRELRVVPVGAVLPEALNSGLVSYYPFDRDEGAKVTDEGAKKNNGEAKGAQWTAKGKVGGACDFDGRDDFIELGPTSLYKTTGHLSACAWVQPRGRVAILLSNYHGGSSYNGQFFFAYVADTGGLDLVLGQSSGVCLRYLTRGVEIPAGEWHHVAFSYDEDRGDGRKVKFYVDGTEAAVGLIQGEGNGGPILDTDENLRIMAHRDTPTGTLSDGLLDEVMIFDRSLTAEDVRHFYDLQK